MEVFVVRKVGLVSFPLTLRYFGNVKRLHNSKWQSFRKPISVVDPEKICISGRLPEKFNFATDIFDKHAKRYPDSLALWIEDTQGNEKKWSYSDMQKESIRTALFLNNNLVDAAGNSNPTPFVLTILGRVPEWWFFHLACLRTGCIFCPGTIQLTPGDLSYRLKAAGANMIVTDETNTWKVDEAVRKLSDDVNLKNDLKKVVVSSSSSNTNKRFSSDWIPFTSETNQNQTSLRGTEEFKNKPTRSRDIAVCFFTSGTTGNPKLVGHSHASTGIGNVTTAKSNSITKGSVMMNLSDTGWAKASFTSLFAPWSVGACSYINQMKISDAKQILHILRTKEITNFCVPPTMYRSMVQEEDDSLFQFKSLRVCSGGGEPIDKEVARLWKNKTGLAIHQVYGQSEMTPLLCFDNFVEGTLGIPNKYFNDIRIIDDSLQEVPPGIPGHLAINIRRKRPVGLFSGYLKRNESGKLVVDAEKTSEVFKGDYYITGDIAYINAKGFLVYCGRADDVISSAGYRIGPSEIESALQSHPAVAESAAVPSPDFHRGEVVKAFIVLSDSYKNLIDDERDAASLKKSIQDHVKSQTAPYKYPRRVEFVNSLPKTLTGKILRRLLKAKEFDEANRSEVSMPVGALSSQ